MTPPSSSGGSQKAMEGAVMNAEARRLLWRCRRGLKELDVLLERYAGATLTGANGPERRVLARLLDEPDPELAGYLLGGRVPEDPELAGLVHHILSFCGAVERDAIEAGSMAPREPLGA